jgi:hypothetical protein
MNDMANEHPYPLTDEKGDCVCQLCGKAFKVLTLSHLQKTHQTDMQTYRKRFPEAIVTSQQTKARMKYSAILDRGDSSLIEEVVDNSDTITDKDSGSNNKGNKISERNYLDQLIEKTLNPFESIEERKYADFESLPAKGALQDQRNSILEVLKRYFPNMQSNCLVRRTSPSGTLSFEFITDFADPVMKVIVDFPDMGWHNKDKFHTPVSLKDSKLKASGWKIIRILKGQDLIERLENWF